MTSAPFHRTTGGRRGGGLRGKAHGADGRAAVRVAGRVGFTARGVNYLLVGWLALRVAFGDGGEADRQGALQHLASEPLGTVMLCLLAAGFACMAVWHAWMAVTGDGGRGGTSTRLSKGALAVFYAAVCWGTAAYAAGSGGSSSDSTSRDWTAKAMGLPGGQAVVGIAGAVVVGTGVYTVVRAVRRKFLDTLDTAAMSRREERIVTLLGVAGNCARGVIYAGVGVFVLLAAVRFDPHKAKGMDDTLKSFAHTPAGPWLLVVVALGLLLYGVFSFACVRREKF